MPRNNDPAPTRPKPHESHLLDTWDPRKATKETLSNLKPHPKTGRLIDSHPGTRTRPMRVLCLGMSRTGTMALFTALQKLGFKPYHMAVAMGSPRSNLDLWTEALRAKFYGEGRGWGRAEFDRLLGEYDAVADVPCIIFAEELVRAYPDAKIVLQQRDLEPWLTSMAGTAGKIWGWNWGLVAPWDSSLAGPFSRMGEIVMKQHFRTLTDFNSVTSPPAQAFHDHYQLVRRVAPADKMLEFRVTEGWGPLCDFLSLKAPDEEFPRVNDAKQFVFVHAIMWWLAFGKMVGKIGAMVAVPAGAVLAAYWWQSRR